MGKESPVQNIFSQKSNQIYLWSAFKNNISWPKCRTIRIIKPHNETQTERRVQKTKANTPYTLVLLNLILKQMQMISNT